MPTDLSHCDRLDMLCKADARGGGIFDYAWESVGWLGELTIGSAWAAVKWALFEGPLAWLANEVLEGAGRVLIAVSTFWVRVPTPIGAAFTNAAGTVQRYTQWLLIALVAVSILIAASQIILQGKGEPLGKLVQSLLTMIVASSAGVYLASLFVLVMDETATWIMDQVTDLYSADFMLSIAGFSFLSGGLGALVAIFFGILQIILAIIQLIIMLFRIAALLLLAGTIPLAFAMTNTSWGAQWSSKVFGWFVAFALYKPAAALVYATGITLMGHSAGFFKGDGLADSIMSLTLGSMIMISAVLTLPALIRLIVPAAGAMTTASGAAVLAGGLGAALGAKQIASTMTGGAASSTGGGSGGSSSGNSGGGSEPGAASGAANTGADASGNAQATNSGGGGATKVSGTEAGSAATAAEGSTNTTSGATTASTAATEGTTTTASGAATASTAAAAGGMAAAGPAVAGLMAAQGAIKKTEQSLNNAFEDPTSGPQGSGEVHR